MGHASRTLARSLECSLVMLSSCIMLFCRSSMSSIQVLQSMCRSQVCLRSKQAATARRPFGKPSRCRCGNAASARIAKSSPFASSLLLKQGCGTWVPAATLIQRARIADSPDVKAVPAVPRVDAGERAIFCGRLKSGVRYPSAARNKRLKPPRNRYMQLLVPLSVVHAAAAVETSAFVKNLYGEGFRSFSLLVTLTWRLPNPRP